MHPGVILTEAEAALPTSPARLELAVIEQAYLDAFKPTLNGRFIATISTLPHFISSVSSTISKETAHTVLEPKSFDLGLNKERPQTPSSFDTSKFVVNLLILCKLLINLVNL
jgi:hypothetical protein